MNFDSDEDSSAIGDYHHDSICSESEINSVSRSPGMTMVPSTSSASTLEIEEETEDFCGDSISSSSSSSASSSSQSLELNPNSSIDNLDLPGIALLKEIFPEETTETLRQLHYKHILSNKMSSSSVHSSATGTGLTDSTENSQTSTKVNGSSFEPSTFRSPKLKRFLGETPLTDLPDKDFLRLPKSVAVLRDRRKIVDNEGEEPQRYEIVQDLQAQAFEEYRLGTIISNSNERRNLGCNNVEYKPFVVDRNDRWGLGMTLQEVVDESDYLRSQSNVSSSSSVIPQNIIIRFGLMVIGFLPDQRKIQNGEIISDIHQSPAEVAGIRCGDILIGINGTAFLLELPLSISSSPTIDRRSMEYKVQKEKIIKLIQNSPSPAVLHVRRKSMRHLGPIGESFSERSITSLLDSATFGENEIDVGFRHSQKVSPKPFYEKKSETMSISHPSPSSPMSQPIRTPTPTSVAPERHPLSIALARRKLIRTEEDQDRITRRLKQFMERARQYESSNSLRIILGEKGDVVPHFDPNDLPPDMAALMLFSTDKDPVVRVENNQRDTSNRETNNSSPVFYRDEYKAEDQQDNNDIEQSLPSNEIGTGSCGPSTPPLSFDSPLIPFEYLQAFYGYERAREIRSNSNAKMKLTKKKSSFSPRRLFWPQRIPSNSDRNWYTKNLDRQHAEDLTWIPLHGIRKALSAHILHSFVEKGEPNKKGDFITRIAYTIWVYDVESGREWYAPIRYWEDFSELRDAALDLLAPGTELFKELSNLKLMKEPPIPEESKSLWNISMFGNSSTRSPVSPDKQRRWQKRNEEYEDARLQTCQLLEEFLRELLGIIYTYNPLHPNAAEIALYVQSFLGVDAGLEDCNGSLYYERSFSNSSEREEEEIRQLLKRSIQRYSWRVFLLHTMKAIVRDFVDAARTRGPRLHEVESMLSGSKERLRARAMKEILQIQKFLDQLVDLVIDGCNDDLRAIAGRHEYSLLHKYIVDESYWDRLVRESVREQVEIEVYVPLRSIVSRLLVNGWRDEDTEVQYKIKELRKRPQGMFRINKISPSHWQSVARILKEGVGMSTLPCVKLRAIVDAAREISKLHGREQQDHDLLGADEFLPIFIFCVVRAQMERPCALSILLQNLCDRINRNGEIGYFLASFEAAVAHIQEIDLTEDREDMLSFLTVPLTEVSLNE